jgi:hypothetical protein
MLMYWLVSESDLRQAALPAHTIATMRQKELPKPELKPNRASRKHLEKNYGKAVPQWTWKPKMTAKTGAAIADLVNGIARAGNDWATRYGLGQKIQAQEPNVRKVLQQHPNAGGVLIVAKYQEWEMRDFTGAKAKTALSAAVAGWGATPIEAYRNWDQLNATQGVISAGAPRGWVVHELYFWAVLR